MNLLGTPIKMNLPQKNENYGEKNYWDDRYVNEDEFDWFAQYDLFRHLILENVNKKDKILHLGCGNSLLPIKMYEDGFHDIVNVDYSEIVIEKMQQRWKHLAGMEWKVADITDLSCFPCSSFDVVLEKGTIDAMLVSEKNPWSISAAGEETVDVVLTEVSRLLKPTSGRFISITFAQPHFRIPLYAASSNYDWNVKVDSFGTGLQYFFYSMTRSLQLSEYHLQLRRNYEERKTRSDPVVFLSDSEDENFLLSAVDLDET